MEEAIKQLKEVYLHIVEKLKGYPIIMSVIAALVAIVAAYSVYYHVKGKLKFYFCSTSSKS